MDGYVFPKLCPFTISSVYVCGYLKDTGDECMVMFSLFLVKFLQVEGIFILTVGCQLVSYLSLLSGLEGEGEGEREKEKGKFTYYFYLFRLLPSIPHPFI